MWGWVRGFCLAGLQLRSSEVLGGVLFGIVLVFLCGVSLVSFSLSSGLIRAPPPYRMVNAGLCD